MLKDMSGALEREYERRLTAAVAKVAHWQTRHKRFQQSLLGLTVLLIVLVQAAWQQHVSWWAAAGSLLLVVYAITMMLRARNRAAQAYRHEEFYAAALARLRGETTQTGFTGEVFSEDGHIYARDIGVLGEDSLFGMLATTRTALGQRALAALLLRPVDAATANARQKAVRELAPLTDLRERIGLLGRYAFEDLPAESFEAWLAAKRSNFPQWPRVVLPILTVLWIAVLLAGFNLHWDWPLMLRNVLAVLAVQGAICLRMRTQVLQELEAAKKLGSQTTILREGVATLREMAFDAPLLMELQRSAEGEDRALAKLERHLILVEQRTKEWFYVASLAACLGTHAAIRLDAWKHEHGAAMLRWLAAWAEFDALVALGAYAAEHEENIYPEIMATAQDGVAVFQARGMVHPLLPRVRAVANDVTLDAATQVLLISGSNMAGKSTLLRSIGANTVLALTGVPVAAESLTMSALTIGASIAIVDSLVEGKSKFLAEVERLKEMVALAKSHRGRMLFLIDEVLSGTNSADRKAAAESVLRSLVETGAIGAMSTHDLTLTSLVEITALHGRNVHMASPVEDDPLAFDYLLKDGVNRTTNAMAIVRMLGLA